MRISGTIIHGEKRGRELGFPTVNVQSDALVEQGVYAVWLWLASERYAGAMHVGPRPTFEDEKLVMEVHIFDFEGQIYGESVEIEAVEQLRGVQKFESSEALVAQIEADLEAARAILYNDANGNSTPTST